MPEIHCQIPPGGYGKAFLESRIIIVLDNRIVDVYAEEIAVVMVEHIVFHEGIPESFRRESPDEFLESDIGIIFLS